MLVTTGCVDVIALSTLKLTLLMVLAGPIWLVVIIYMMSIIIASLTNTMAYRMIGILFHINALILRVL